MKHSTRRITLTLLIVSIVALSCTVFASSVNTVSSTTFSVNANGETYGNLFQTRAAGEYPDLILATGEDGVVGYVRSEDLEGTAPATPEEALAIQEQHKAEGYSGRYVNLYDSDGETVIGSFFVEAGTTQDTGSLARGEYTYGASGTLDLTDYTATGYCGIRGTIGSVVGITITQASEPVQAGWLGGKVRIYDSNGTLVKEADYVYTSSTTSYFSTTLSYYTSSGYYYCYGLSKAWNPSGGCYGTFGLGKTAYQAPNT